jgi:hypothetical protein
METIIKIITFIIGAVLLIVPGGCLLVGLSSLRGAGGGSFDSLAPLLAPFIVLPIFLLYVGWRMVASALGLSRGDLDKR